MSSTPSTSFPTKKELITDLKNLAAEHPETPITRNFYRGNGKYKESHWQKYFSSFSLFIGAAEVAANVPKIDPDPEISEVVGDSWTITLPKTRIHTLEELLEYAKVDLSIWQVERWVSNKWEVGAKNAAGNVEISPLFQVKATFIRRKDIIAIKDEIAALKNEAKKSARIPKNITRPLNLNGTMLELNVPDLHLGKLAWSRETGYGNYDTKIALETFRVALDVLLSRVSHYKFDSILFVVGNDLLHSDDAEGRTTSGTYVNTDGRYHKTFIAARDMLIEAVERLRLLAPVKVLSCPGNHDSLAAWHVTDSLECYFHNYEDVEVDNTPRARKYHQYGKVMLMFTHGHTGKRADYPLTMAAEEPQMWGETKYREAHTGHIHQTKTEELHGVRVRVLPALCETDAWHSANGFTNNLRVAEAYVWSKSEGLIAQAFHSAD